MNTSVLPFKAIQYNGISDSEFIDVPLGNATITDGALTGVSTYPYNQNGFDVNTLSAEWQKALPDYSNGVSNAVNTAILAESDGFVVVSSNVFQNSDLSLKIGFDSTCSIVIAKGANTNNYAANCFHLNGWVRKGMYYMASGSQAASLMFYPCVGS